ncbi:hypothetical protein PQ478_08785 [Alkalihalophilus pseudofirmus]|uniref:hypothetical protein n=1 Tax=Alkalihalophilus pseudofirmus TaxID=79885 RepID=UPI00259BB554|nr:hypothetical protein [Alkalihalophilus pseudofirmus]WEG18565.1 hypothetical protein PQ478_08785 [Alkalihalophilus pseudofirmus]
MREPLKDGDVRQSNNGVAIVVGVWQDGEDIQIISKNQFKTSVNEKEGSVRCHKNLYKHLRTLLQDQGKWKD